jgi:hypothetical protein
MSTRLAALAAAVLASSLSFAIALAPCYADAATVTHAEEGGFGAAACHTASQAALSALAAPGLGPAASMLACLR